MNIKKAIKILENQPIVKLEELSGETSDLGDAMRLAINSMKSISEIEYEKVNQLSISLGRLSEIIKPEEGDSK